MEDMLGFGFLFVWLDGWLVDWLVVIGDVSDGSF